ncbi:hypothetical protein [Edaphobacter aggregans]|uniref:hypothetical protein n=1 Tax=Edaphobacter aggregans TaxID=570835 RepID=UPI0012F85FC8|nr:hypothetical protein [Edaphobacter aggregans]
MRSYLAAAMGIVISVTSAYAAQSDSPAGTPAAAKPEVSFQFERPGLPVPKFSIVVYQDGTGMYRGEEAPVSGGASSASLAPASRGRSIDRPMKLSPATAETIFRTARSLDYFNIPCASKAKNIADTGKKTLSYAGPDGRGSCLYNYSENKSVTQLTETFQALAFTMDEGRKLEFLHRYDRLGLYSEMDTLIHEIAEKRAIEIINIAPTLTSIVADEQLMQRVREKAARLLAQASDSTSNVR